MLTNANRLELLQVADAVAKEKDIDRQIVMTTMEEAIQRAARLRYGQETEIEAKIDGHTGEVSLARLRTVVEKVEDYATEITVESAKTRQPEVQIGDIIKDPLPPLEFGRVAAQSAKQVIFQKVREAEKERQYLEYKDRVGEIINAQVKRVEYGNVIVDIGHGEAIVKRDQLLPREVFRYGDRIRAIIYEVREDLRGPQVLLSRTNLEFIAMLFRQEVPEIYDGIIEIKGTARDPGSRAKIAVFSQDASIDPVGACVGMRGSRVQAVVNELQGEKIDIIPWSGNMATLLVSALAPASVAKVILDEDNERVEVVVPDEQLSLAIGRRGQNVRLASQLTGWSIDILTEEEEAEKRQKEFTERNQLFQEALDIDEMLAQLLFTEGFVEIEEIAYIPQDELAAIQGFDSDMALELQRRAVDYLKRNEINMEEQLAALGVAGELGEVSGMTSEMMITLGKNEIKSLQDLADCATDDLAGWKENVEGVSKWQAGILGDYSMARSEIDDMILTARKMVGLIEEEPVEEDLVEQEQENNQNNEDQPPL